MGSPLSYDYYDQVILTTNVRDATKTLANATAVTVTITLPDEVTTASPSVANPSVGVYQFTYVPTVVGIHTARWTATGVNASSFVDVFDVRDPNPPYLVSLADVKSYLNITSAASDEQLRGFIEAATGVVENVIGPVIIQTITEVHTRPGPVLQLQQPPVIALVSLMSILTVLPPVFGASQVYDVTTLDADPASGIVRRLDGLPIGRACAGSAPVPLRAVYSAGRRTVPAPVTLAARIIIDGMWDTQRGHFEGIRPRPGGGPTPPKKGRTVRDTIPPLALEMLQPYRRPLPIM